MGMGQSTCHLNAHVDDRPRRNGGSSVKTSASDQCHGAHPAALNLFQGIHLDQIGMAKQASEPGFLHETIPPLMQDLQRDWLCEPRWTHQRGFPHHPCTTLAEGALQAVSTDLRART